MSDLISREALREDFYELEIHGTMAVKAVLPIIEERIDNLPAVDAVEVVHGRWIVIDDDYGWDSEMDDEFYYVIECECSECHERVKLDRPNYCPNCGADMRERKE